MIIAEDRKKWNWGEKDCRKEINQEFITIVQKSGERSQAKALKKRWLQWVPFLTIRIYKSLVQTDEGSVRNVALWYRAENV